MSDRPQPPRAGAPRSDNRVFSALLPWLVAVTLAVVCIWLAQLLLTARAETALRRDQHALAEIELRGTRQQLEAERILAHATQKRFAEAEENFAADTGRDTRDAALATVATAFLVPPPSSSASEFRGIVLWIPGQPEAVLHLEGMPAATRDHVYYFQISDPSSPDPIDAARFTIDPANRARHVFHPKTPLSRDAKFSLTRESRTAPASRELILQSR